jgi:hypothetical protein
MSNPFFDHPILNSPYESPRRHWELDASGQRITKQWLDTCLQCKGGTYPAQIMYQELADIVLVEDGHGPDDLLHLIIIPSTSHV